MYCPQYIQETYLSIKRKNVYNYLRNTLRMKCFCVILFSLKQILILKCVYCEVQNVQMFLYL